MNDIYSTDFSKLLPSALRNSPQMIALARTLTEQLLTVSGSMDNVLIYSRFEELPEDMVDIMAYDMHVDWYDYSYPLQVKRDMVKNSVRVHKRMGTRYAVENVLNSLHPQSHIEEWFEYGGSHHCFRIVINADNKEYEIDLDKIIKSINMYKRLSAHLESVILEIIKSRKIFAIPVKEVFVQRNIKINQFTKTVNKTVGIVLGSAGLRYVSLTIGKGLQVWKEQ